MQWQRAIAHGDDVAVDALHRRAFDMHARQRNIELLRRQHRQRSVNALPHLHARHGQHNVAFGGDLDPAIQRDLAVVLGKDSRIAHATARRHHAPTHHQGTTDTERPQQKAATPTTPWLACLRVHFCPSRNALAARLMATRTRGYVPQRQMFVMAASISASLGSGTRLSRSAAAMSMPDWQ